MALSVPSHPDPRPARRAVRGARGLAALAAALLAALTALTVAAPAGAAPAPPTTSVPAEAAAGWLARQFVAGSHLETPVGGVAYPDAGLTLDAVLAFSAAGVAGDSAASAMDWLGRPANLGTYVGDGTTESYAGALAKLSLAAEVRGLHPTAFGSPAVDLLARLRALLAPSGRFSDKSQFGDFSNAFGQAYAILALGFGPRTAPASAVDYLAKSECDAGGFPLDFEKPTCVPDTDATALAAQALADAGATQAAGRAITWLLGQQKADGSFGGGTSTEAANANSTGLAAQALNAAGKAAAAGRAAAYLRTLQSGCSAPVARRGAIQYQPGPFVAATAPRATGQAVLGLAGVGLADLDGTGGAAAAPVLACAPAPTPTSTAAPTTAAPTTAAPTTGPPTQSPTATPAPVRPPSTSPAGYGGSLPATGTNAAPLAWLGIVLVGIGAGLGFAVRRRRSSSP